MHACCFSKHNYLYINSPFSVRNSRRESLKPLRQRSPNSFSSFSSMEKGEKDGTIMTTLPISNPNLRPSTAKKRSAISLLWAAIFTVRHHRRSSNKKVLVGSNTVNSTDGEATWKTLVGGIRPLHLQQLEFYHNHPPLPPPSPVGHESFHNVALAPSSIANSPYHDVPLAPPSPATSSDWMSQYASADDLQALHEMEGGNNDEVSDTDTPNAIDMQAEEFIAKFYKEMKLQRLESSKDSNMIDDDQ